MFFSKTVLAISSNYSVGIKGAVLFSNASLHAAMPSSFRTGGYSLQTLKQKKKASSSIGSSISFYLFVISVVSPM